MKNKTINDIFSYLKTIPGLKSCTLSVSNYYLSIENINDFNFNISTVNYNSNLYQTYDDEKYKTLLIQTNIKPSTIVDLHQFLSQIRMEITVLHLLETPFSIISFDYKADRE